MILSTTDVMDGVGMGVVRDVVIPETVVGSSFASGAHPTNKPITNKNSLADDFIKHLANKSEGELTDALLPQAGGGYSRRESQTGKRVEIPVGPTGVGILPGEDNHT